MTLNKSISKIVSTTGQRMNLIGSNPVLNFKNSQLDINAITGRGIYLQGTTPHVLMDNSQVLMTDTGASQGIILQGTDALLSLSNQSELSITGAGTGTAENIQIGNNNARPELSITGESKVSVTTTSGTAVATDTSNNALAISGLSPKVNVLEESEICIDIASGMRRGLSVVGNTANINFEDSKLDIQSAGSAYYMNSESPSFSAIGKGTEISLSSLSEDTFNSTSPTSYTNGSRDGGEFLISDGAVINVVNEGRSHGFVMYTRAPRLEIMKGAKFYIRGNGDGGTAALRFLSSGTFLIDNAHVSIDKPSGTAPAVRFYTYQAVGISPEFVVRNGGKLNIHSVGSGSPIGSGVEGANQAFYFTGSSNLTLKSYFRVDGRGSEINFSAENGPAIDFVNFPGEFHVSNFGSIIASGRTPLANQGAIVGGMMNVTFDNPLFMDFKNTRAGGGNIFSVSHLSILTATNSDLAVWRNGVNLDNDPDLNFRSIDYVFSGENFNTLSGTSDPNQLNTDIFGTTGLTEYTRMSSNNGRWAIADELRVPTNADKKIHGRVSLPVGLDDSRPAWDNEAIVTVEVESPSDEETTYYTAKTVGDTNESPGISIYGEEPRGGLFEIDLDEPLEAGSKVRISKVELASGELADGFEHQILTDTVEVFPIIPPTPAQFSSSIIAQDSTTIQGTTDNLDAEVTATHNGEPLNTEAVIVDDDGRFTLDLSEVSLAVNDEIQVFLRDAEGSAVAAGVVNPPETNNARGNINPSTEFTFHDVTFEPATTLIVGDIGPVSPVDPLDPEVEVNPENKPELPEDQGQLSIDFISSFDFGSQTISVHDQTYYAKPQRLLNEDGTVNESEERPNYVQISDRRSENERNGWILAVTQKEQFKGAENQVLNGASLSLSNQQVITAQGGEAPGLQSVPCTLVPGNRRTLLQAQGSEGTGTWIYRFGDGETAGESVSLNVPRGANPEATTYSSTLIWELSAVPGN
ncbi:WxL domain-containing protein [Enterococcus casseliflavus]|nr:WxL domain-containing protein [Enterococcus casseliflavus]